MGFKEITEKIQAENKKRIEAWRAGAPSVEELLCLQLSGYSSKQIHQTERTQLKELILQTKDKLPKAQKILQEQTESGIKTISYYEEDYPRHFMENLGANAPILIHLLGNEELIHSDNCVTIIGARKANTEGLNAAYRLGYRFASEGHPIVSGLALGCDTATHRGCLDAGGKTIAIIASGLNVTHPKVNKPLQKEIINKGGLILSEHPIGIKANPTRLVARCRLQVVLSQKVIVAQCPIVSGTMYAVHFAQEYDGDIYGWENEIYAVEYEKYSDISSGNRFLLEQGLAIPITIK